MSDDILTLLDGLDDDQIAALVDDLPTGQAQRLLQATKHQTQQLSLLGIAHAVLPDYHERAHATHLADIFTDAIKAAERGEDTRIIVCLPPGFGKSSLGSVALPLAALQTHPDWEVGIVSAEESLARKFSRDILRAIKEDVVSVALKADNGIVAASEWETAARGGLIARGIGGSITGRRLKMLLLDDPIKNLAEAYSPAKRKAAWEAWQGTLKPRMRPGSVVVLIQTRWHQDDLAGRLLKAQTVEAPWIEVRIPAIAEADDPLGRAVGEPLLSPQTDQTPEQALALFAQIRAEVGTYVWDALYQQRPSTPGGSVFREGWWRRYDNETQPAEADGVTFTSWDLTFGTGGSEDGDYVVGQVWQQIGADLYLLDMVRGRWNFTDQLHQIRSLADRFPYASMHLVEEAANGAAAIATLRSDIAGIIPIKPRGSKEVRAQAVAPTIESGNVFLPETAPWLADFMSEVTAFPTAPHDDVVDAMTQALFRVRSVGEVTTFVPNAPVTRGYARAGSPVRMRR